jgi:hypothetical protein
MDILTQAVQIAQVAKSNADAVDTALFLARPEVANLQNALDKWHQKHPRTTEKKKALGQ